MRIFLKKIFIFLYKNVFEWTFDGIYKYLDKQNIQLCRNNIGSKIN